MEKIVGKIIKVNYYNNQNGFAFVRIKIDFNHELNMKYQDMLYSNILTVGCTYAREPLENEEYIYTGEFVETKYGIQLKATSYTQDKVNSKDAIVTYLSSDYFPSIGKATAAKIYDVLGKDALNLIASSKDILSKVPGLSQTQIDILYDGVTKANLDKNNLMDFINMGFTLSMATRITSTLSPKILEKAIKNPYYLINRVEGIGFIRADKIALGLGIKPNDPVRIRTCISYILSEYLRGTGNTYISSTLLKEHVFKYLENDEVTIESSEYDKALDKLVIDKRIIIDSDSNISDAFLHNCEQVFASTITNIIKRDIVTIYPDEVLDETITQVSKEFSIKYSETQKKAIKIAIKNNITIITGGPGTGKTTIVKGIIKVYERLNKNIASQDIVLLAPTGRAGKRLNEVALHSAKTIHSFLGFDGHRYQFDSQNRINCQLVIVDEVSMVDIELAYRLFTSINENAKIVLVGDADQIPSVGPGQVLNDLIRTQEIDVIKLDKIHRQAENSSIISLAHKINNGIIPEDIFDKKNDRSFIKAPKADIINCIKKTINVAIEKGMDVVKDIQVLIPRYKGEVGIDNVNRALQDEFNPLTEDKQELVYGTKRFRIGDKVLQQINRKEDQIMNGDIGFVIGFKYQGSTVSELTVYFDGKTIDYSKEDLDQISLGYAISIHKSQGSEFKTVIIPLSTEYYIMLKRKLYYTAITRAKDYLILIGDIEALKIASLTLGEERHTKLYSYIKEGMKTKELTPFDFLEKMELDIEEYEYEEE